MISKDNCGINLKDNRPKPGLIKTYRKITDSMSQ